MESIMQHEKWHWRPEEGGAVDPKLLDLKPVDPIVYKMKDVWGFDVDELPCEPFDIEIRIKADTVAEGLVMFEHAVKDYMLEHFDSFGRELFVQRLNFSDEFSEQKTCEIIMSD